MKFIRLLIVFQVAFLSQIVNAQDGFLIRGKITSTDEPNGVPGVTVVEIDANNRIRKGTISNFDGEYAIEVLDKSDRLQFSFIGYKQQTIDINDRNTINIVLEISAKELTGVDVIAEKRTDMGLMSIPDRDLGIPISKISTEEFENVQASTIDEAIQGRLAGVDIAANSGDPGAGMSIRIRGVSTLSADNKPMIVVDGVPLEINIDPNFNFATANEEGYSQMLNISMDDIKEITVLKDAAATAMWGTKAANGVLVITTKRGVRSRSPRVSLTYRGTFIPEIKALPLLSGDEYSTLIKEAVMNTNNVPLDVQLHKEFLYQPTDPYFYYNYGQNTDWMDAIQHDGYIHNVDFAVDGGGSKATYRFSTNYQTQQGVTIGTGLNRLTTRLNLDYFISDKLRLRADFSYAHGVTDGNYSDIRSVAYRKMPNMSIYEYDVYGNLTGNYFSPERNIQGSAMGTYNPVAMALVGQKTTINDRIRSQFGIYYDINKYLRISSDLSLDVNSNKVKIFLPQIATGLNWTNTYVNRAGDSDNDSYNIFTNTIARYHRSFSDIHVITASLSAMTNESIGYGYDATTANSASSLFQDPSIESNILGSGLGNSSTKGIDRSLGVTAMMHYSLLDRYIVMAGLRREGNSRFDANNRWGTFPSISLMWRLSGEEFMQRFTFLDDLRIRYSYGENGHAPRNTGMFFNNYNTVAWGYLGDPAVYTTDMKLVNLKWEQLKTTNVGATVEMYKNRLHVDFDYYKNRTEDMFAYNVAIQSSSGFTTTSVLNAGTMDNYGWDFNFRSWPVRNKKWRISFDMNVAKNYNILREVNDKFPTVRNISPGNGEYMNIIQIDNPAGAFYGYKYKGVYTTQDDLIARDKNDNRIYDPNGKPITMVYNFNKVNYEFQLGDAMYEDINHDGNINASDVVLLGDANPDFFGGFGQEYGYKNFSFRYNFYFRVGNQIINRTKMLGENMYSYDNQTKAVLRRWRKPGDETDIPRSLIGYGYNWLGSDRYVEDGSFMRLKYVSLSYNLPKGFAKKMGAQSMRVSATLNNLLTFTNYSGQDPEININSKDGTIYTVGYDDSNTPVSRQFTFNLNVVF
ncbi:SusC/RagA family TonB-linked outer membrane protein [Saccharicrinis sp. FJH54]|uniref:SusC/RagA family TonB-linked outer membrane protein n=1 Tax=Saccharicrinis sp. FJH54 TaxID=3344665 RepID=UPI0035D3F21C